MAKMNPKVDAFLNKAKQWQKEMATLRAIILDCGLIEELKWAKPCYISQGRNIVIIQGFKGFCALLFTNGALLKDAKKILEKPGENTQAARRIPFTTAKEILEMESILKAYIKEAIKIEKAGLKVDLKKTSDFIIPEELKLRFENTPALKTAFTALTPGRQRAYLMYFTAPKQPKTRESRIEKCLHQILAGQGLND